MRVEYQAVSDISGPLLFVEGVSGVSYGELCSIKLPFWLNFLKSLRS